MAQTSSDEFSQIMVYVLEEVVDVTREIADLSSRIVTKLQRPLVETRDHIRFLVKDTWTLFTTISQKIRTVREILKKNLPHEFNLSDTPEPEQHIKQNSVLESLRALDPFTPMSSSTPPVNTSLHRQTRHVSKQCRQKSPIQNTKLPPSLPTNGSNLFARNDNKAIGKEYTYLNDFMAREGIKFNGMPSFGFDSDSAKLSSFPPKHLIQEMQKLLMTELRGSHIHVLGFEHLVDWMAKLRHAGDSDYNATKERLFEFVVEEICACCLRGVQVTNIASGDINMKSFDITRFLSDINQEVEQVKQSRNLPVRGNGPDTILCLDTSASMCGENFRKMILAANKIIDGVEELANSKALQGNVAVVTFGAHPFVNSHLTNNYSQVRNVLDFLVADGPSSLHRGLSMSMVACIGNYGEVSVNDVRLMTRIIVLTDGMFSAKNATDEHYGFDIKNEIMVPSAANLMKLNGIVCDCVHVGASAESLLLQKLTKTTNGKIFPDDHVDELVNKPTHLFAATKLLHHFQDLVDGDKDARNNEEDLLRLLIDSESASREAIGREISESEKETIIALAMNVSNLPLTKVTEHSEYLVQELDLQLPPVGTRVRRGPDWDPADNKDSNGPGTVVCHNNNGTADVLWDCCSRPFPYRCDDPCQVLSTDNDERMARDDGWIQVGCKVVRGPDWTHGDEDGGRGSCGIVCLCTRKGTVTVRWPSRKIGKYRYGVEVILLDTGEDQTQAAEYHRSVSNREFEPGNKQNSKQYQKIRTNGSVPDNSNLSILKQGTLDDPIKKGSTARVNMTQESDTKPLTVTAKPDPESNIPLLWSYLQEGEVDWTMFDVSNNEKLETDWSKQRKTTIVTANYKRYRVVFGTMAMFSIDDKKEGSQLMLKVKREERKNRRKEEDLGD